MFFLRLFQTGFPRVLSGAPGVRLSHRGHLPGVREETPPHAAAAPPATPYVLPHPSWRCRPGCPLPFSSSSLNWDALSICDFSVFSPSFFFSSRSEASSDGMPVPSDSLTSEGRCFYILIGQKRIHLRQAIPASTLLPECSRNSSLSKPSNLKPIQKLRSCIPRICVELILLYEHIQLFTLYWNKYTITFKIIPYIIGISVLNKFAKFRVYLYFLTLHAYSQVPPDECAWNSPVHCCISGEWSLQAWGTIRPWHPCTANSK